MFRKVITTLLALPAFYASIISFANAQAVVTPYGPALSQHQTILSNDSSGTYFVIRDESPNNPALILSSANDLRRTVPVHRLGIKKEDIRYLRVDSVSRAGNILLSLSESYRAAGAGEEDPPSTSETWYAYSSGNDRVTLINRNDFGPGEDTKVLSVLSGGRILTIDLRKEKYAGSVKMDLRNLEGQILKSSSLPAGMELFSSSLTNNEGDFFLLYGNAGDYTKLKGMLITQDSFNFDIPLPEKVSNSAIKPRAMNDQRLIVATVYDSKGEAESMLFTAGSNTLFPSGDSLSAFINNSGQVAGSSALYDRVRGSICTIPASIMGSNGPRVIALRDDGSRVVQAESGSIYIASPGIEDDGKRYCLPDGALRLTMRGSKICRELFTPLQSRLVAYSREIGSASDTRDLGRAVCEVRVRILDRDLTKAQRAAVFGKKGRAKLQYSIFNKPPSIDDDGGLRRKEVRRGNHLRFRFRLSSLEGASITVFSANGPVTRDYYNQDGSVEVE